MPCPRTWRRPAALALVFLTGGLIANVLIAWSFSHWGHADFDRPRDGGEVSSWPAWAPANWPPWGLRGMRCTLEDMHGVGVAAVFQLMMSPRAMANVNAISISPSVPPVTQFAMAHTVRVSAGFPLLAFSLEYGSSEQGGLPAQRTRAPGLRGGLTPPWSPQSDRLYPIYPLWPGSLVNTVLYASLLYLPFFTCFRVRRWQRLRRGLCSRCAYDLRGTTGAICPECGAPVHPGSDR